MSLKIDWGREGLSFQDSAEDPCPQGDIIMRKWCRISPAELRLQLLEVKGRVYVLTSWNCQHFSDHFFLAATEETDVVAAARDFFGLRETQERNPGRRAGGRSGRGRARGRGCRSAATGRPSR